MVCSECFSLRSCLLLLSQLLLELSRVPERLLDPQENEAAHSWCYLDAFNKARRRSAVSFLLFYPFTLQAQTLSCYHDCFSRSCMHAYASACMHA